MGNEELKALVKLEQYANDMTARCASAAEGSRTDGDYEFANAMEAKRDAYSNMTMRLRAYIALTPPQANDEAVEAVARAMSRTLDSHGDTEAVEQQRVNHEWRQYEAHARAAIEAMQLQSGGVKPPCPIADAEGQNRRRLARELADYLPKIAEEADENGWEDWGATMRHAASTIRTLLFLPSAPAKESE